MQKRLAHPTKKSQILGLYAAGARNISELAALTHSRPSYVAQVLRGEKALRGYFDLYTTTQQPMNIYSTLFANRLGFRTPNIARRSIQYIDRIYENFAAIADRSGQHHALVMALTMCNRARWSRKYTEAKLFRKYLTEKLQEIDEEERREQHNNHESATEHRIHRARHHALHPARK